MKAPGYIKLHRSFLNWEWYTDANTRSLFLHLLLTVNHKKSSFQGHEIPQGSRVCSYSTLAEETGLSVRNVRTSVNHLKSTGEVTISKTPKFSIISIKNWSKYQQGDKVSDNRPTSDRQHPNNVKNINNSKDTLKGVSLESGRTEKEVSKYRELENAWD